MKRRILLVGLLALTLVSVFVSSALAKKPEIRVFEYPPEPEVIDCDEFGYTDFDVITIDELTVRFTTFFDKDDNPTELQVFARFDGIIFRSDKPEQTYKDMVRGTIHIPFDEQNESAVGITVKVTVPGKGKVAFLVGRVIYDENGTPIFSAGPGTDKSFEEVACDGFAGL